MSRMTIVGGVHGAGKSTLCRELHAAAPASRYLTNEEVRRTLEAPLSRTEIHALLREHVAACFASSTPFLFEHVMSGHFVETLLSGANAHGFTTHLVYLDLPDAAASLARVADRVAAGGHDVEREQLAARLRHGRHNFWTKYRHAAATWQLYDGSGPQRVLIASGTGARIEVVDAEALTAFERRVESMA